MPTIDPGRLFPNERTVEAVAAGEMTQITRGNRYAEEGEQFEIGGERFEVVEVTERKLGDLTDTDAHRENTEDLAAYKKRMVRTHGGEFEWDDNADVVTHRVARTDG